MSDDENWDCEVEPKHPASDSQHDSFQETDDIDMNDLEDAHMRVGSLSTASLDWHHALPQIADRQFKQEALLAESALLRKHQLLVIEARQVLQQCLDCERFKSSSSSVVVVDENNESWDNEIWTPEQKRIAISLFERDCELLLAFVLLHVPEHVQSAIESDTWRCALDLVAWPIYGVHEWQRQDTMHLKCAVEKLPVLLKRLKFAIEL